ncbi:MAG: MFS transporter [Mycobacterium leprae]
MELPAGIRALKHRDFRLFWTGQVISQSGSWMQIVGHNWLVLELTRSPLKISLISVLQFAPMLLFSLLAGAMVDRWPKRRLLVLTQVGLALTAFGLGALVWSGHVRYWHIAVLAVLVGCLTTLDFPARHSLVPAMVSREDLISAQGLNAITLNTARVLGPAIGGLLIDRWGISSSFFMNGISFVPVILALVFIRSEGRSAGRRQGTVLDEVREGIGYSVRNPIILFTLCSLLVIGIFVRNYGILVPLLAKQGMGLDAKGYSLLLTAQGVGSLLGAIGLTTLSRRHQKAGLLILSGGLLSLSVAGLSGVAGVWGGVILLGVAGFVEPFFFAGGHTILQIEAPDDLRGRVMSLFPLVSSGSAPLGASLIGFAAERLGVRGGFITSGSFGLVSIAVLAIWWLLVLRHSRSMRASDMQSFASQRE